MDIGTKYLSILCVVHSARYSIHGNKHPKLIPLKHAWRMPLPDFVQSTRHMFFELADRVSVQLRKASIDAGANEFINNVPHRNIHAL
jgi:hypothetical protein